MLEVQEAIEGTGADVHIMCLEGLNSCFLAAFRNLKAASDFCHKPVTKEGPNY